MTTTLSEFATKDGFAEALLRDINRRMAPVKILEQEAVDSAEHVTKLTDVVLELADRLEKVEDVNPKELARLKADVRMAISSAVDAQRAAARREDVHELEHRVQSVEVRQIASGDSSSILADQWRGKLTEKSQWHRGELWFFHGTTFLALKDGSGVAHFPGRNMDGTDSMWAPFAVRGAQGLDALLSGQAGVPQIITTPPPTATSPGLSGQFVFSSGYLYYCYDNNKWRRVALTTF